MDTQWIGPACTLASAGIAATMVWKTSQRRAPWNAVKADLDIAAGLPDDDPMRSWLHEYASVRIRYLAIAETRGAWWHTTKTIGVGYGLLLIAVLIFAWLFYVDRPGEIAIFWPIFMSVCTAIFLGQQVPNLTSRAYRIPGLDYPSRTALRREISDLAGSLGPE
ncbi:hypothetical protein L5I01_17380 [Gordonia sp. HY442]|uniref:hypothetical protein n=1 Tax=Gordonia zhenghanii TaxID=2911516 RepID=UPI001F1E128F|nr:hypothetical protein [Gordonia zhenghanii]MCF8605129.1 hypothetical protein [Gordonia zhenghanii]